MERSASASVSRRQFVALSGAATAAALLPQAGWAQGISASDPLATVDPELRPAARRMIEQARGAAPLSDASLAAARSGGAAYAAALRPDIPVQSRMVPGPKGAPDVQVYLVNRKPGTRRPGIVHLHGGGFILGAAKWELRYVQDVAAALDCVIASVEYRLAPETGFAGSVEDNYAALRWLYGNADALSVDPDRIAVMGESAGGGHAALLAIAARDRGEVPLVLQTLIYPMLDDRTGSGTQLPPHIGAIGWDARSNAYAWGAFLGTAPGTASVPVAAVPARLADLRGLAPAFVGVGGIDLFVSEDMTYTRRLTEAGVPTELLVVPGAFHAFDRIAPETQIAQRFDRAKLNALRRAFGEPSTS